MKNNIRITHSSGEEINVTLAYYDSVDEAIEKITGGYGFEVDVPFPYYIYDEDLSPYHPAAVVYRGKAYKR